MNKLLKRISNLWNLVSYGVYYILVFTLAVGPSILSDYLKRHGHPIIANVIIAPFVLIAFIMALGMLYLIIFYAIPELYKKVAKAWNDV